MSKFNTAQLTLQWPREGEGGTPYRFYQFFSEIGRAFLQTKFLAGRLSMKKFLKPDIPSWP